MTFRPSILALAVLPLLVGGLGYAWGEFHSLRADNAALRAADSQMKAAVAARDAALDELKTQAARADLILGEWSHDRDQLEKTRAELRSAVNALRAKDQSFAAWGARPLPLALAPGGGLLGAAGNRDRAASAAHLPAVRAAPARPGP